MVKAKQRAVAFSEYTTGQYLIGWFNIHDGDWRPSDLLDLDSWRWVTEAACADTDPEAFFDSQTDEHYLSYLCNRCPVRAECLEHALVNDEYGWWGGTSRRDRQQLIRERVQMSEQ